MAEWLYEAGIGENRAALVEDGAIVEAAIELEGAGPRVGMVARARLIDRAGLMRLESGAQALLDRVPAGVTQGAAMTVRITREPLVEPGGRPKLARAVPTDQAPCEGLDLLARLRSASLDHVPLPRRTPGSRAVEDLVRGSRPRLPLGTMVREAPVRILTAHGPDLLERAGWSELLEEARTGEIGFAGGSLRMWPTPAMTLFDVDGAGPLEQLAIAAADSVGRAIRRHCVGGSIGIDFPTLGGKAARQAVAEALDASLPPPLERTAMNGFGFLQVVRPRLRPSLPELLAADRAGAEARALLRRWEREPPGAQPTHRVSPAVLARMRPDWLTELARRTGVEPRLEPLR